MLTRLALLIFWISLYLVKQLLPSYEVNIESSQPKGGCFPEGFNLKEDNFSRVDNLMLTSYEGNDCFIIPNYSKMLKNVHVLLCRRQQNNLRYSSIQLRNQTEIFSPQSF